jgi:NAD(P)-dependent dehydrogenase (short-subunit alcohol dehydrogenase family)
MAGRVEGKVAFITGAARSQGRSHALRLAQECADIIAVDIAGPVPSIEMYPPATEEDLAETVRQVEALDRRIVATKADVRDTAALKAAVDNGVAQLGRLLLSEGVHPRVVMEVLGHAQMRTTTDTYSHVMPALGRDAADRMGSALWD